ncbi:MAG: hypothetical protein J7530_05535 [Novosphingobium sp.]|nr:hypothetical protein [Novosphingobium sp.]
MTVSSEAALTAQVTAYANVDGSVFVDVNQTARSGELAISSQPTLISERIAQKTAQTGKTLPNGNMADAHAEIGAIQQAFDSGNTQGQSMVLDFVGKDVCGFCRGDIAAAASKAGLNSLTVNAIDNITGLPKFYTWSPGMKSIKKVAE